MSVKFSQLPAISALTGDDLIPVVQNESETMVSKIATVSDLVDYTLKQIPDAESGSGAGGVIDFVEGNFPVSDENGQLIDSGVSPYSFISTEEDFIEIYKPVQIYDNLDTYGGNLTVRNKTGESSRINGALVVNDSFTASGAQHTFNGPLQVNGTITTPAPITTGAGITVGGTGTFTGEITTPQVRTTGSLQSPNIIASTTLECGEVKMTPNDISVKGVLILSGAGDPNGAALAPVGSLYLRSDGGAGTTLYVKESGTGSSGWVAK